LGPHGRSATHISKGDNAKSKKSILVVDDSPDTLTFNKMILEMEDYEVFTASSGGEALHILTEMAKPDLILLDIRMDDISGPEFLEILEKQNPEILEQVPVVFLTAMDEVPKSKAKGFIQKPIDIDNFLIAVRGYLDGGTSPPHAL